MGSHCRQSGNLGAPAPVWTSNVLYCGDTATTQFEASLSALVGTENALKLVAKGPSPSPNCAGRVLQTPAVTSLVRGFARSERTPVSVGLCKEPRFALEPLGAHQMLSLRSLAFILCSAKRRSRAPSCAALDCSPDRTSGRKTATKMATNMAASMSVSYRLFTPSRFCASRAPAA